MIEKKRKFQLLMKIVRNWMSPEMRLDWAKEWYERNFQSPKSALSWMSRRMRLC